MVETSELRARFARALSAMYGHEVPAYTTLVQVTSEVNADFAAAHPARAERWGSLARVSAERHGAVRLGTPAEMYEAAQLFAGFGMHPVGFYDLRDAASPVPVVSTAFRPIDPAELSRNPFRVFTSLLAVADRRFFDIDLAARLDRFLAARSLFAPELLALATRAERDGGLPEPAATEFVDRATAVFALTDAPVDRAWYRELEAVSPVAADIGGVAGTHVNHLTPRVLDIDELYRRMTDRGIAMIDRIQGPPRWSGPAVLLRQTSFRALAEPRRFLEPDGTIAEGTLRVRFGEVEARGVALTPAGRALYDRLDGADASIWEREFPADEEDLDRQGLAYFTYRQGTDGRVVREPIVYEDFLPASAAGIFRSNLDADTVRVHPQTATSGGYDVDRLAGFLGRPIHDPFDLYRRQQQSSRRTASPGPPARKDPPSERTPS
ncbi:VOC family protein [Rhodococcus triatomae]|uniref:2-oxoadipate dioxygenase/decarboxylase n=1 Tax=Rhodococcus triatomae TaxID=300028 RepID=A0A1G8FFY7_9NOCA|nr:VOC family protein [Rhodococcus triatomae]QNG19474.1 VOC family protein [Rhodococcus triatomae]QNG24611.1 VOC family protein [Rhodococcus triatomae]SDH81071.1 Uncharacterized metalloenzyme YdcJ, glyoxalase superfamily [Rhodococcus triatomae]